MPSRYLARMHRILLILSLLAPLTCLAQKGKKKPPSEKEIRASLVSRADVAITLGDLDSADVLLARALWMWPDETGSRKRAGVLLQKGDTTGYCIQTSMYKENDPGRKAFYLRHCTRSDSVPFADSGLSPEQFPGMSQVARTWSRSTNETTYRIYDAHDTLALVLNIAGTDTVYGLVDVPAVFPGGEAEMFKFLMKTVRYPPSAMDEGISGVAYVTFDIGTTGMLEEVRVLRGVHHAIDEESLRVVRSMPAWTPAEHKGRKVRSRFNLPIRFTLM